MCVWCVCAHSVCLMLDVYEYIRTFSTQMDIYIFLVCHMYEKQMYGDRERERWGLRDWGKRLVFKLSFTTMLWNSKWSLNLYICIIYLFIEEEKMCTLALAMLTSLFSLFPLCCCAFLSLSLSFVAFQHALHFKQDELILQYTCMC